MARDKIVKSAVAQLLAPAITPRDARPRRDWTARTRDTALNAIRYSRFVAVMKGTLPIAAAIVIAAVLVYSFLPRQTEKVGFAYERMGRIDNDLAMIKPKLTGTDNKSNPFVITADAAIQEAADTHRVRLKNAEADLAIDKDRWLNASAANGYFDMDAGRLKLVDGIAIYSDSGYEIHTSSADVDLKKGTIAGPDVTGQGPLGIFRADRFNADRYRRQVHLEGNVHMTMYLAKAGAK